MDETGKKSLWNKDEIRVLNGENLEGSAQVYATMAENATSATFTIKDASASFTGTHFIAACPAAVAGDAWWNGSVDKTINKLWLKPEQTAVAGGYDPDAHIAVAYTEGTDLLFKNACALLYFTVKGDNVSELSYIPMHLQRMRRSSFPEISVSTLRRKPSLLRQVRIYPGKITSK